MSEEVLPKGEISREGVETNDTEKAQSKTDAQQDPAEAEQKEADEQKTDEERGGKDAELEPIQTDDDAKIIEAEKVRSEQGEIKEESGQSDGNERQVEAEDAGVKTDPEESKEAASEEKTEAQEEKTEAAEEKVEAEEEKVEAEEEKTEEAVPGEESPETIEESKEEKAEQDETREGSAEEKAEEDFVDERVEAEERRELPEEENAEREELKEGSALNAVPSDKRFSPEPEVTLTAVKSQEKDTGRARSDSKASHISVIGATESQFVTPPTPRISRISYDGADHPQHMEARDDEIQDALNQLTDGGKLPEEEGQESAEEHGEQEHAPEPSPEPAVQPGTEPAPESGPEPFTEPEVPAGSGVSWFRARAYNEKKIMAAMKQAPPRHEFMGYVFSSQTPRPHGVSNFFLPIVPQPTPRKHICVRGATVPHEALHPTMKTAPRGLMPLSAVRICWGVSPRKTVYTLPDLYAYLTRFGSIEAIYQRCPNSALVIFCDLTSACACVRCPSLGMPWDRLVASWWEPRMANGGYLSRHLREEAYNNHLADLAEAAGQEEGSYEVASS